MPYVHLRRLEGKVAEVAEPVDPFPLAELVAPLADGQEIVGEQSVKPASIAAQLGVVEGPLELKNVVCHSAQQ
jgi:hypothetical protein